MSNNPAAFGDIEEQLDAALASERGIVLTLKSPGAATYWHQRACHYRALTGKFSQLELTRYGPQVIVRRKLSPVLAVQRI